MYIPRINKRLERRRRRLRAQRLDLHIHHLRDTLEDRRAARLPAQRAEAVAPGPAVAAPQQRRPRVHRAGLLDAQLLDVRRGERAARVRRLGDGADDRGPGVLGRGREVVALAAPGGGAAVGLEGFGGEEAVGLGEVGDVDV